MLNQPIRSGLGPIHHVLGMTHEYRQLPGNGIGLVAVVTVPAGLGAPLHSHDVDEEIFYVLSGQLTVELDGTTHVLAAGDSCYLPLGSVHSFSNRGSEDARFLAVVTPGAGAYEFFRAVDAGGSDAKPEPEQVMALGAEHGLAFA